MFPDHAPRVCGVRRVSNPNQSYHCDGQGRVRDEGRAVAVSTEFENDNLIRTGREPQVRIRTNETRGYVPPELPRFRSNLKPDLPARCRQPSKTCRRPTRRRSRGAENQEEAPAAISASRLRCGLGSTPRPQPKVLTPRSQGRGGGSRREAVRAAHGPRRSKI